MSFRLTRLSMEQKGNLTTKKELTESQSALQVALDQWRNEFPFAQQGTDWNWKGTNPAMAAALFKGEAQDLLATHGDLAVVKACQVLSGYVAALDPPTLSFGASWPAAASSIYLSVSFQIPLESTGNAMEGEGFSEKSLSLEELEQEVAEEMANGGPDPRFVFDPLTMLPDDRLLALAEDLDRAFPQQAFAQLAAAGAILLAWKASEKIHSDTFAVAIGGLTVNGKPIQAGLEARTEATVRLMDVAMKGPTEEHATEPVAFSVRRPRLS